MTAHDNEVQHAPARRFIAGAIAGGAAKTVIAPLDRTKILMQISRMYGWQRHRGSVLHSMRDIFRTDGFFGFFRGNSATIARIMPHAAIQYSVFEFANEKLAVNFFGEDSKSPMKRFLAGAFAGSVSVAILYPIDIAHTVLAVRVGGSKPVVGSRPDLPNTLVGLVRERGVFGLYRGAYPTLMGVIPLAGIRMSTYGILRKYADDAGFSHRHPFLSSLLCGGSAGIISQFCVYPVDVVRKRLQALHNPDRMSSRERAFLRAARRKNPFFRFSIYKAITFILRTEGFRSLYRGVSINFLKTAPAMGVSVTVYEASRKALGVPTGKYSATKA